MIKVKVFGKDTIDSFEINNFLQFMEFENFIKDYLYTDKEISLQIRTDEKVTWSLKDDFEEFFKEARNKELREKLGIPKGGQR